MVKLCQENTTSLVYLTLVAHAEGISIRLLSQTAIN